MCTDDYRIAFDNMIKHYTRVAHIIKTANVNAFTGSVENPKDDHTNQARDFRNVTYRNLIVTISPQEGQFSSFHHPSPGTK